MPNPLDPIILPGVVGLPSEITAPVDVQAALIGAVQDLNPVATCSLALKHGDPATVVDYSGSTLFHVFVESATRSTCHDLSGRIAVINILISHRVDMHAQNAQGKTALELAVAAAVAGHTATLLSLVTAGADVHSSLERGCIIFALVAGLVHNRAMVQRYFAAYSEIANRCGTCKNCDGRGGQSPVYAALIGSSGILIRLLRKTFGVYIVTGQTKDNHGVLRHILCEAARTQNELHTGCISELLTGENKTTVSTVVRFLMGQNFDGAVKFICTSVRTFDANSYTGASLLLSAIEWRQWDNAESLLIAGASIGKPHLGKAASRELIMRFPDLLSRKV